MSFDTDNFTGMTTYKFAVGFRDDEMEFFSKKGKRVIDNLHKSAILDFFRTIPTKKLKEMVEFEEFHTSEMYDKYKLNARVWKMLKEKEDDMGPGHVISMRLIL